MFLKQKFGLKYIVVKASLVVITVLVDLRAEGARFFFGVFSVF